MRELERKWRADSTYWSKYSFGLIRSGQAREAGDVLAQSVEQAGLCGLLRKLAFVQTEEVVLKRGLDVCWQYTDGAPSSRVILVPEGLFAFNLLHVRAYDLERLSRSAIRVDKDEAWTCHLPVWESRKYIDSGEYAEYAQDKLSSNET